MKNNLAKETARKILIQNKLYALTDYNALQRIVETNRFTIIEYKKHTNSEPVSELINRLRVENETQQYDSFLYIHNNLRFIFINAELSDEDKCSLLRHELGHIIDPNFKNGDVGYSKIKREEFANEFSLYSKNPGIIFKFYIFIIRKWKLLIGMIALIACILGLSFIMNSLIIQPTSNVSTSGNTDHTYYITSGGKKYHRKFCIIVKYRTNLTEVTCNEAINTGYKPCLVCMPGE